MEKIVVTGASGQYGKATLEFLLKKGVNPASLVGLVRSEAKGSALKELGIPEAIADYDDYGSLVRAFQGAGKLVLVSGSDINKRAKQHQNAIQAAQEAGVKHIIYTSLERKNETADSPLAFVAKSHLQTEELLKESGVAYTILRNNLYLDMLPMYLGEKVLEKGIYLPAGKGKAGYALRSEMAEATAAVAAGEGHDFKVYYFSNPENTSFDQIASLLGGLTGKDVSYSSPDPATYREALSGAGVPAEFIAVLSGFAEGIAAGELESPRSDLEILLGRKPTSVKAFLAGIYG